MSDIVVYTAITNNYDTLKEPPIELRKGIDFIAFLDCNSIATSWQIKKACSEFADPYRNAKIHKILSHVFFPEKNYSLWIDGSVEINFTFPPMEQLIDEYLKECDLAVFKHRDRRCIYEEADECIRLGRDDPAIIRRQMANYMKEGHPPDKGLAETTVLLRRHTEKIRQFNEAWHQEIRNNSRRDQLSFNYVAHKTGLKFRYFPGLLRHESNDWFHIQIHQDEKKTTAQIAHVTRLRRRKSRADWLMLVCAILTFAWVPAGLILIFGGTELRPVFRILLQLWPLAFIPLCGAGVCWLWRSSLKRKIKEMK